MNFTKNHPINWYWEDKKLADRGGAGDIKTPTPAVLEFLNLLDEKRVLFSQDEYADYCLHNPKWAKLKPREKPKGKEGKDHYTKEETTLGIEVRLKRNFYPSMIDSLYVWAMLAEAKWFDTCEISAYADVVSKNDLVLTKDDNTTKVALIGPKQAIPDRQYKKSHRGRAADYHNVIEVILPSDRPRKPGNKRWYCLNDFYCIEPRKIESNGQIQLIKESYYTLGA